VTRVGAARAAGAWVVTVAVVLAGCGVTAQDDARVVAVDELDPYPIVTEPSLPPPTTVLPHSSEPVTLFFVRGLRLVPVSVRFPGTPEPLEVLQALAQPARADRRDVFSALLTEEAIASVDVREHVAVVDLGEEFESTPEINQILALAQIVFTVTEAPGIRRVRFTLAGERVETPRADGSLTRGAVTRADYERFAPRA
jgi:hypothetical protein